VQRDVVGPGGLGAPQREPVPEADDEAGLDVRAQTLGLRHDAVQEGGDHGVVAVERAHDLAHVARLLELDVQRDPAARELQDLREQRRRATRAPPDLRRRQPADRRASHARVVERN
jgi:hypothetical protein